MDLIILSMPYRMKNIWSPPGIEPRTACIAHKRSVTELRQPPVEQTLQFCIYTVKGYCYATVSLSTDQQNFSFFKDSHYSLNFSPNLIYHFTISFSAFFHSLDVFSLFHRLFLNNTELKICIYRMCNTVYRLCKFIKRAEHKFSVEHVQGQLLY